MSVYTPVPEDLLRHFLTLYDVGELVAYEGISAGIENTNYFVTTEQATFVLTLFEQFDASEVPWYLELMHHLSAHDIPSADPVPDQFGRYLNPLCEKPATLVQKLAGGHASEPNVAQCAAIGRVLAEMHLAGNSFDLPRENGRGPRWFESTAQDIGAALPLDDIALLREELAFQSTVPRAELPQGVIHADLFHDNALFVGDAVTGVIDFYYACNDALLYDVAVTANDWCSDTNGALMADKVNALTRAYAAVRAFTDDEHANWNAMLRAGALRFWLSRLKDKHFPRGGELTHIKDPNVFRQILLNRTQQPASLAT